MKNIFDWKKRTIMRI